MVIKTVIFDIGHVLLDIDNKKVCRRLARFCDHPLEKIFQVIYRSGLLDRFEKGKLSEQQFFRSITKKLSLRLTFREFRDIFKDNLIGENKEVANALRKLKKQYRILLLSNNNSIHYGYHNMLFCDLFSLADRKIISYRVKTRKPEKAIYRLAIRLAKAKPGEILYLDDLRKNITAARAFGIDGIHYSKRTRIRKELKKRGISL